MLNPSLIKKLSAFAILGLSGLSANAEQSAQDIIYQATINSYYSVNSFYNYSANQADQEQGSQIQFAVGTIDDLIQALVRNNTANASSLIDTVQSNWLSYEDILNQNIEEIELSGYPDLRLAGDMATTNIAFNQSLQALYSAVNSGETGIDDRSNLSYEVAETMALMMTKYSARSTSTVSQVYAGGDAEVTIDDLAGQFENQLSELTAMTKGKNDALKLLDSAKTKWEFIRSSYINYNENRVNFVINLYSKKIIKNIEDAAQI